MPDLLHPGGPSALTSHVLHLKIRMMGLALRRVRVGNGWRVACVNGDAARAQTHSATTAEVSASRLVLVLPIAPDHPSDAAFAKHLGRFMLVSLNRVAGLQVVSQEDIELRLGIEKSKDAIGCTSTTCAAEIAGALDAKHVIVGSVGKLAGAYQLTLRILDTGQATTMVNVVTVEISQADVARSAKLVDEAIGSLLASPGSKPKPKPRPHPADASTAAEAARPVPESKTVADAPVEPDAGDAAQKAPAPAQAALSKADIVGVVRESAASVAPCLKAAKARNEIVEGTYKFILDWTIRPDGSVAQPRLTGPSNILATSLPRCFEKVIGEWRFPASSDAAPVTNFPFGPITVR